MNRNDYNEVIELAKNVLKNEAGWVPRCFNCYLYGHHGSSDQFHNPWVTMNVRSLKVSGSESGTVPPHVDLTLKCPECRRHQFHGLPVTAGQYDRFDALLGDLNKFDAAADAPDDDRDERLRDLGYLD